MRIADRPFAVAVLIVSGLAVSPSRITGGVLRDASSIFTALLNPPAHLLQLAQEWLRPPTHADAGVDPLVVAVQRERDTYRSQLFAAQEAIQELEAKVEQLGAIRRADPTGEWRLVDAAVGVATPTVGKGMVQLLAGTALGIAAGDVAIVRGDLIAGRVAASPSSWTCTLVPMGNPGLGRIDGAIVLDEAKGKHFAVQLQATANGLLECDVPLDATIPADAVVRLRDAAWPKGAQGMVLGRVRDVRRKDQQPLRGRAVVAPAVDTSRLAEVTLKATGKRAP